MSKSFLLAWIACANLAFPLWASELSCPKDLEGVHHFETVWAEDFSRYPSPIQLEPWLRKSLLDKGGLSETARAHLKSGGSPLFLDVRMIEALGSAYRSLISASHLESDKKASLVVALEKAIAELKARVPESLQAGGRGLPPTIDDSSSGGGGGPGGNDPFFGMPDEVVLHLKSEAIKRCVVRTGILFFASNVITIAGAIEAKWTEYAEPGDRPTIDKIFEAKTWENAVADKDFRHNIAWNALLMTTLGAFSCVSTKDLASAMGVPKRLQWVISPNNILGVIAALTSMAGQYAMTGEISVRQTLVDTLFVRFISIYKSRLVFRLAEGYARRGLPVAPLVELSMQGLSEGFGAMAYPRANTWSKKLWNDDKKQD